MISWIVKEKKLGGIYFLHQMADMVDDNRNTIVRVEAGEDSRSEFCPLWQFTECLPKVVSI